MAQLLDLHSDVIALAKEILRSDKVRACKMRSVTTQTCQLTVAFVPPPPFPRSDQDVLKLCVGPLIPLLKESHNLYLISTYILSKLVCMPPLPHWV